MWASCVLDSSPAVLISRCPSRYRIPIKCYLKQATYVSEALRSTKVGVGADAKAASYQVKARCLDFLDAVGATAHRWAKYQGKTQTWEGGERMLNATAAMAIAPAPRGDYSWWNPRVKQRHRWHYSNPFDATAGVLV